MTATKKQRKLLRAYVRWVADSMELRDWSITLVYDPPADDNCLAHVKCVYGRKIATITFPRDFFDCSPERQRHAITHELVHLHFSGLEWQYNNLSDRVAPDVFHAIWGGLQDQLEFAVDAMASAVAKHLPMPKQAKGSA